MAKKPRKKSTLKDGAKVYAQQTSQPAKKPVTRKQVMAAVGTKPKAKTNIVRKIALASPQAAGINTANAALRKATRKKKKCVR